MLVFAYGSLVWNPGFAYEEAGPALARGWQRKWCVRSVVHRGTPERPGLALGLVPGGSCVGVAYRLGAGAREALAYLEAREGSEGAYARRTIAVTLACGRTDDAQCWVAERTWEPAGSRLADAMRACGLSGRAADYAAMAVSRLPAIAVPDGWPDPCHALPPEAMSVVAACQLGRP